MTISMSAYSQKQTGAVLIMGLVLLMALTIVGVAMIGNNTLEQRMAGNAYDSSLAFNAAETASRDIESRIFPLTIAPTTSGSCASTAISTGLCVIDNNSISTALGTDAEWWKKKNNAWWQSNATDYNQTANFTSKVNSDPRAIVVDAGFYKDSLRVGGNNITGTHFYKITTRGTGASDNSQAIVQWDVAKRTN